MPFRGLIVLQGREGFFALSGKSLTIDGDQMFGIRLFHLESKVVGISHGVGDRVFVVIIQKPTQRTSFAASQQEAVGAVPFHLCSLDGFSNWLCFPIDGAAFNIVFHEGDVFRQTPLSTRWANEGLTVRNFSKKELLTR